MVNEAVSEGAAVATYFAPPERASREQVSADARAASEDLLLQAVVTCVDGLLLVLNRQRQVLLANEQALEALGAQDCTCVLGLRPGEVLQCLHADEGPNGCGTSRACALCGAVRAILKSQESGQPVEGECLATVVRDGLPESLELRVRATPVRGAGQTLTALVLNDISGDKRRAALEQVFFHDILNTIGGLVGWGRLLEDAGENEARMAAEHVVTLARRLEGEVRDQRRLTEAEQGTLEVSIYSFRVASILGDLRAVFEAHPVTKGKLLEIGSVDREERIQTDPGLLLRVLVNMVKNAFEASGAGDTVRVWYEREGDRRTFAVHNPAAMPEDVQLRVFSRSFSTKGGAGRGLGTYSMKLFGERYLGGRVRFTSSEKEGTLFAITFAAAPEAAARPLSIDCQSLR